MLSPRFEVFPPTGDDLAILLKDTKFGDKYTKMKSWGYDFGDKLGEWEGIRLDGFGDFTEKESVNKWHRFASPLYSGGKDVVVTKERIFVDDEDGGGDGGGDHVIGRLKPRREGGIGKSWSNAAVLDGYFDAIIRGRRVTPLVLGLKFWSTTKKKSSTEIRKCKKHPPKPRASPATCPKIAKFSRPKSQIPPSKIRKTKTPPQQIDCKNIKKRGNTYYKNKKNTHTHTHTRKPTPKI